MSGDHKDSIASRGIDGCGAREAAKCRQNANFRAQPEARKAFGLASGADEADGGMDMSRQDVSAIVRLRMVLYDEAFY